MDRTRTDTSPTFWVLEQAVPSGPWSVADIHARLAAGKFNWEMPACRLGDSTWQPLRMTPGIGPGAGDRPALTPMDTHPKPSAPLGTSAQDTDRPPPLPANAPSAVAAGSVVNAASPAPGADAEASSMGLGGLIVWLLVLLAIGYGVYQSFENASPHEVCERFLAANTPLEAKRYASAYLHPAIDFSARLPDAGEEGDAECVRDAPAPPEIGGHFVAVTSKLFIPEEGRQIAVEGVCHLVSENGWKVHDLFLLKYDRQRLPQPFSMALDYRLLGDSSASRPVTPVGLDGQLAKAWHANPNAVKRPPFKLVPWLSTGWRRYVLAVLVIGALLGWLVEVAKYFGKAAPASPANVP